MEDVMPVAGWIRPEWVEFLFMAGAFLLVAVGTLIWMFFFRKRRRRRKHRHHPKHHQPDTPNITLAQKGGLPPIRQEEKPPGPLPPTFFQP